MTNEDIEAVRSYFHSKIEDSITSRSDVKPGDGFKHWQRFNRITSFAEDMKIIPRLQIEAYQSRYANAKGENIK